MTPLHRPVSNYQNAISEVHTHAQRKKGSVVSEGNEVIVPASGETAEEIARASAILKIGILIGGDLNIIRPFPDLDKTFLALTISNGNQQKELSKRAQGKTVVHLHNSDLETVNIRYPELSEQKEISAFFQQIDSAIDLHQRKLNRLKEHKSILFDADRNGK